MENFDINIVARRSVQGVAALVSRTFIIQLLSIVASFILTIYLNPASYGVFFIVSSIVVFLTYFQDIGLAAALIQKKEQVSIQEYRATFTLQQILVLAVVIPALFFSGSIINFYKLGFDAHILLIALIISFLFSSLRTIPTVMLERNVDFKKLVIPQIAENLVYNLSLIVFAIAGFGIHTFTIAILSRGLVGLLLTYIVQPWRIGFSFNFKSIKSLVSFGIPFQANSLLALVKDDLLIVYVGTLLSSASIGYIGFAQKWAFLPLRLVMDNVIKVTFPSYSRLQHDKEGLKLAIEKSLFLISIVIFPIAVFLISYSQFLVKFIPKYEKWEPALISLAFFSASTIFASISTPLTNFLNAIGKVKITLIFMIGWTIATWILTPLLITRFGYSGFAIASFIISLSSVVVVLVARRYVDFSFMRPVFRQFIAALLTFIFIALTDDIIDSFVILFVHGIIAICIYSGILYMVAGSELKKTLNFILKSMRGEKE